MVFLVDAWFEAISLSMNTLDDLLSKRSLSNKNHKRLKQINKCLISSYRYDHRKIIYPITKRVKGKNEQKKKMFNGQLRHIHSQTVADMTDVDNCEKLFHS